MTIEEPYFECQKLQHNQYCLSKRIYLEALKYSVFTKTFSGIAFKAILNLSRRIKYHQFIVTPDF